MVGPLRIAQVAPLYERVPPLRYGGTERVVSYLTEGLVESGHDVTLFASGDSLTRAELMPGARRGLRLEPLGYDAIALHLGMLLQVYDRAAEFDVIHCHTDYLGLPLARASRVPTLLTLHGRLDLPEAHPVYRAAPGVGLVSVSAAQRALGRISPEKQPDAAIRVAVQAGIPLKIAAKVDRADVEYFATVVRPLLDHPLVEFLGEVDDRQKGELLGQALALLFPVDWPEPFGLALVEAFACGTPVIARPRGSVPEIVRDGRTGFLCETEKQMAAAATDVGVS